ncbi:MAG: sigma-70 family RNA polymerase sigma factor [Bacteroidia bacterium]|jgi:RNA polymerase sigma factor (sigma-70 family)|nr:sigma-70 family RNA polymerase sigma factor [Bacteroidia bacterium]
MSGEKHDDISLIKACSNGDHNAFNKIYNKYSGIMYSICLRYMNSHNDAQDALQEGFIKVYNKISSYSFSGSFEGWMKRIFINTSIELIRKKKYHRDIDYLKESEIKMTSKIEIGSMDAKKMIDIIQKLPQGYRTVFNMYVIDGYSHKEISKVLSISESTSKTQLFKARKQLQIKLKGWFE